MNTAAFHRYLTTFQLHPNSPKTKRSSFLCCGKQIPVFTNEFWTARQRQANSLHEISYRACFKPQLPHFFIHLFTQPGEWVYDPFNGRGTTTVEAALMGRHVIANDINPLSGLLTIPRIKVPPAEGIGQRLATIEWTTREQADTDLSMFYHPATEMEILALRHYLLHRQRPDDIDRWIRMVATNRLTGHSKGFFSVYTLPPNQAVTADQQNKINRQRKQHPEYRNVAELIWKKSLQLLADVTDEQSSTLHNVQLLMLNNDAATTRKIADNKVSLTVTSPPFLDVVKYASDNWLRCWFNGIDVTAVEPRITMSKTVEDWRGKMEEVLHELYRITRPGGVVAMEVGEVRNGRVKLEESIVPAGLEVGFQCEAVVINEQTFTKTANIWGVKNNHRGTNSNRIVVFRKK